MRNNVPAPPATTGSSIRAELRGSERIGIQNKLDGDAFPTSRTGGDGE